MMLGVFLYCLSPWFLNGGGARGGGGLSLNLELTFGYPVWPVSPGDHPVSNSLPGAGIITED